MNTQLLSILAVVCVSSIAEAQTPASRLQSLYECRALSDPAARLPCLDAAVDNLRQDEIAGEFTIITPQEAAAQQVSRYGLPNLSGLPSLPGLPSLRQGNDTSLHDAAAIVGESTITVERDDDGVITRIRDLPVAEWRRDPHGKLTIILQNGQVWRQTEGVNVRIFGSSEVGDMTVTIRSGALTAHYMQINNRGRWFRAARVD